MIVSKFTPEDRAWLQDQGITPEANEIIRKSMEEMSASMHRQAGERDLQKEIVARVKELAKMNPKLFKKLAKTYHLSSFTKEVEEHEEFTEFYTKLVGEL